MRCLSIVTLCLAAGCATTTSPRFEQSVATSFAQDDMRKLVTANLEVYYPAQYRAAAVRIAARGEACLSDLRKLQPTKRERPRALLFLTSANYNNAYVTGQALGEPLHSVNPVGFTDEFFLYLNFSNAEAGDVACHELVHYAHFEQLEGFWRVVNLVFGDIVPTQPFLERWFAEGAAQFYEGRLGRKVGRPHSPLYRGAFDSFVALRGGQVGAGDLQVFQRELYPWSGAYLTSLPFVEYLAATHGEEKLWELMDLQGRAIFTPLGVALRFKAVYGKSLGALIDDWGAQLSATTVKRTRPAGQRVVLRDVGQQVRLAADPHTGRFIVLSSGNDEGPRLRTYEPNGALLSEQRLQRLGTDRDWIFSGPGGFTGLSFTRDGRLYLVHEDLIDRGDTRAQLWQVDLATGDVQRVWQAVGKGIGGAVRPDGSAYTFIEYEGEVARLVDLSLPALKRTVLATFPAGQAIVSLSWSPDGARLLYSLRTQAGWDLHLRDSSGQVRALTGDGQHHLGGRFADETRIVFLRAHQGRLQVHQMDVDSGALERLTDAPFVALDPAVTPAGEVLFVNRDDVGWSVDAVSGAALAQEAPPFPALAQAPSGVGDASAAGGPAVPDGQPAAPEGAQSAPAEPTLEAQPGDAPLDAAPLDAAAAVPPAAPQDATPAPVDDTPPLEILSDEAASGGEGLFVPLVRGIGFSDLGFSSVSSPYVVLTAALAGRDRLGFNSWALNGAYNLPTGENSVTFEFANQQLAPASLGLYANRSAFVDETFWNASINASRVIFTSPLSLGFSGTLSQPAGGPEARFIGPSFAASYAAGEFTSYGGTQRLLAADLGVSAWPRALGSSRDMYDLRSNVSIALPLPLLRRHSLVLGVTGHIVPGAPEGALRVGGLARGFTLYRSEELGRSGGPPGYLPGNLTEAVRGFEDSPVRATAAAIVSGRYRYPFIIDRGFASILYLFPSVFFRQVDVEAFGTAAFTDNRQAPTSRAAGAAIAVRGALAGAIPWSVSYQFAWRFDRALPPLHLVSFAFE